MFGLSSVLLASSLRRHRKTIVESPEIYDKVTQRHIMVKRRPTDVVATSSRHVLAGEIENSVISGRNSYLHLEEADETLMIKWQSSVYDYHEKSIRRMSSFHPRSKTSSCN